MNTATIARWIKTVLKGAGLDVSKFKAHSTRAAATSAAKRMEVPIDHILTAAGWSQEKTFSVFYNKPLVGDSQFAESVLSSASLT